ncbi:Mxi neural development protein [Fasciola hepatica]|uniref:Mxi neural development protein n=1 Tax=Fasciola hepatica TaxID=6192 RepID=A0A2H1BTH2_FASHE|nr:Mxi neural development protein [Fasciola hepatica]
MSLSQQPKNGLLLLLQAAKKLDEEDAPQRVLTSDRWEHRTAHRNIYDTKYPNTSSNYPYNGPKRQLPNIRCTHNELEKSRRAHLRACMETLKEHLNFDNDVPRITMLTVLKKATATIQYLRQKNQCLETYEDSEKQRSVQLHKRRQALRKKLEEKRNRSLKLQSWRERNRNCSECSINTTSSDDSEIDAHLRSGVRPELTASFGPSSPPRHTINNTIISDSPVTGQTYMFSNFKHLKNLTPPLESTRSPVGLDAFDANSSDSGFEEITITSSGAASPEETPIVCTPNGSLSRTSYISKTCRAF